MSPYVSNCNLRGSAAGTTQLIPLLDAGPGDGIGFLYFSDGTYTMSLQMLQMLTRCNVRLKMGNIVRAVPKTYPRCAAYGWGAAACSRLLTYSSFMTAVGTSVTVGPSASGSVAPW